MVTSRDRFEYSKFTEKPRKQKMMIVHKQRLKSKMFLATPQEKIAYPNGINVLKLCAADRWTWFLFEIDFNQIYTKKNQQDPYLSLLITVLEMKRRRPVESHIGPEIVELDLLCD